MRVKQWVIVAVVAAAFHAGTGLSARQAVRAVDTDALARAFANPPDDSRIMMRWWWFGPSMTREQAEAHQAKHGFPSKITADSKGGLSFNPPINFKEGDSITLQHTLTLGKRRRMTRPEREMELILSAQQDRHEIVSFRYEGIRLKWGEDPKTGEAMWYKPDFFVTLDDIEGDTCRGGPYSKIFRCIEVKGPWISERDLVRFKGARAAWPCFEFEMHQRDKEGRWTRLL